METIGSCRRLRVQALRVSPAPQRSTEAFLRQLVLCMSLSPKGTGLTDTICPDPCAGPAVFQGEQT